MGKPGESWAFRTLAVKRALYFGLSYKVAVMKDKAVPMGLVALAPSGSRIGLFRVVKNATGKTLFLLSFLSYFIVHIILS